MSTAVCAPDHVCVIDPGVCSGLVGLVLGGAEPRIASPHCSRCRVAIELELPVARRTLTQGEGDAAQLLAPGEQQADARAGRVLAQALFPAVGRHPELIET